MLIIRRSLTLFFLIIALPVFAQSQTWPDRPIRFIVPFPAGGSTDAGSIKLAPSGPFIAGSYCSVEYIDPPIVARTGLQPF